MVRKGVKYLVLLSRRTKDQPEVQGFLNALTEQGCKALSLSCDVSNSMELVKVLEECKLEMPPIRGVIQAAMVLQVRHILRRLNNPCPLLIVIGCCV